MRATITAAVLAATMPVAASAAETITYSYDANGRLIQVRRTGSVNNGVVTDYRHDAADNRARMTVTGSPSTAPANPSLPVAQRPEAVRSP